MMGSLAFDSRSGMVGMLSREDIGSLVGCK
jgi:hypothetical protein